MHRTIGTKPGEPALQVELTEAEVKEHKAREVEAEKNKRPEYETKRADACEEQIDGQMKKAVFDYLIRQDDTLLNELRVKFAKIESDNPKPTEV